MTEIVLARQHTVRLAIAPKHVMIVATTGYGAVRLARLHGV